MLYGNACCRQASNCPIPTQEACNALMTTVVLKVSMVGGDHLSDGSPALENTPRRYPPGRIQRDGSTTNNICGTGPAAERPAPGRAVEATRRPL
ncbi:hypothetical protein EVAR_59913_1 [Eumeta japonica]|uniref:Uncharacterized protein n=1 Tax=Eumeta variegata TaxID=151549 RepID=A0A4C1YTZ9_EUMVA|nr:hypothetical protein EVAR_59913_1 [Eumeta japonica]